MTEANKVHTTLVDLIDLTDAAADLLPLASALVLAVGGLRDKKSAGLELSDGDLEGVGALAAMLRSELDGLGTHAERATDACRASSRAA